MPCWRAPATFAKELTRRGDWHATRIHGLQNAMPPIPAWNSLHPLIVHSPIALLMVAPILMIVGLLAKPERALLTSALIGMALGTTGAWLAVATGEAAGHLARRRPPRCWAAAPRPPALAVEARVGPQPEACAFLSQP